MVRRRPHYNFCVLSLAASARLTCWLNAWLRGAVSADSLIAAVTGRQTVVAFGGFGATPLPPALLLGQLRAEQVSRVSVALPVPGDPLGLGGPRAFNAEVIDAGEGVVLHGSGRGLIPRTVGSATRWEAMDAEPPMYLPDVGSADRALREAIRVAATELAELDVAAWSADVVDELMNLRTPVPFDGAVTFPSPAAATTAVQGARCLTIVTMAGRDVGGALSATVAARRQDALAPLGHAARNALVAACSSPDGR